MTGNPISHEEELKLSEFLVSSICNKASGHSESECARNYPRDVYFIGNLRPVEVDDSNPNDQASYRRELMSKLSPSAFGVEFCIKPKDGNIEMNVEVSWACYYRIFPEFNQQQSQQFRSEKVYRNEKEVTDEANNTNYLQESSSDQKRDPELVNAEFSELDNTEDVKVESDSIESKVDRHHDRSTKDTLLIRFRKISCVASGSIIINKNASDKWTVNVKDLQDSLHKEVRRAQQIVVNDPAHIRAETDPHNYIRVSDSDLASQSSFEKFIKSLKTEVMPEWKWEVLSNIRHLENPEEISVTSEFLNISPMPVNSPNVEAYLFDTKARFHITKGTIYPFKLNLSPSGFRYDQNLWSRGFNCSVEIENKKEQIFSTTHSPVFKMMRYVNRTKPRASFADLSEDPVPLLDSILKAMKDYIAKWIQARKKYINDNSNWEFKFGKEFESDLQIFHTEIDLFGKGLDLIRKDERVRKAFKLTNETFRRGDPKKTAWRLFQIVFIVNQIPGILALSDGDSFNLEELEKVDIIYFPTGGGKTEAYLGLIVFNSFYDRLRGKTAGVTAWTRFPLRLLTLQQTQRAADVIGQAELVRSEQSDDRLNGTDIDGFSVGYYVGASSTPNIINPPNDQGLPDAIWSQATDPKTRQSWKRVVRCPSCRTATVTVHFDQDAIRILHQCENSDCRFPNGIIPVFVIDNEIYRYLPTVIVGTIDKLAGIGSQRKVAMLFGQVDGTCKIHGYYKKICCQKNCKDTKLLNNEVPNGLSGPTLFIQDELHLLKEGLGTFDSHYETFVQRLREEFGQNVPLKIVASSATIEAFHRQVEHLYGRDKSKARIFPGPGPTLSESFYAEKLDYPQRLFIGIIPHNKTIFNSILELIEYYHREIQNLQNLSNDSTNPYGGELIPATTKYKELLDFYATSITYFLANRDLNSIRTDLIGDVNPSLERSNFKELELYELTGSTSSDDVARILEDLETPKPENLSDRSVLATSMISHGIDVDRFNTIFFYGMPRLNAEYIQASSRVGRAHVGIVFCCLHPVRERDQSHYSYFVKFHEFLGQMVEPVAINRWSKFSISRTLPGLFMGILLNIISNISDEQNPNRYYILDFVKKKISEGAIKADDFIPFLEQAFKVEKPQNIAEKTFKEEIQLRVQQFLDQIIGAGPQIFVSNVLIPTPMRSLRDVDEPIEIELDSLGTEWAYETAD